MPQYTYTARSMQGRVVTGVADGPTQIAVARQLREQGLTPTMIAEGGGAGAGTTSGVSVQRKFKGRSGRVKLEDLVVFSRQFATMIRAGLPLIEVLSILSEQAEKISMKTMLKSVEREVEGGSSLTEALEKHPKTFNTFFVSMVKAGEAAGMLASILDQIATYLEKVASLQRKVKSAVVYPAVVSSVAAVLVTFLMTVVVPVFEDIFAQLKGNLPLPTRAVIGVNRFMSNYWFVVVIVIFGAYAFLHSWYKTRQGRFFIDRLKLRLPVFGPLFMKVAISKFSRTLSTLIRSGVNILAALEIVAATAGNAIIEDAIFKTRVSIQNGESISKPLVESGIFPPMVTRMIDVGERVGSIESMLSKVAEFYEDQVDAAVSGLTSMIEPILIVGLGLVIGFIVIAMFMPMFDMVKLVN